jgi:hypothetical protein
MSQRDESAEADGKPAVPGAKPGRMLSPAERRALEEAAARRAQADAARAPPEEVGGRNGPEPTRYGDWEKRGIASDF